MGCNSQSIAGIACHSVGAQADWAPRAGAFFYASRNSGYLVSLGGTASEIPLRMPGKLSPLTGMTAYALSADAKQIAYLLYTRDTSDTVEDKSGKLYMDLMIQSTQGSTPVCICNDGASVLRPA